MTNKQLIAYVAEGPNIELLCVVFVPLEDLVGSHVGWGATDSLGSFELVFGGGRQLELSETKVRDLYFERH